MLCPRRLFQFTRPRGARLLVASPTAQNGRFNSRAREGRDLREEKEAKGFVVSIHAPARGATDGLIALVDSIRVSIHAPARGATVARAAVAGVESVSIHAPARGATMWMEEGGRVVQVSIHAPARGATPLVRCVVGRTTGFNSRAREGRDGFWKVPARGWYRFNSRAREGRDSYEPIKVWIDRVSIHARERDCR